LYARSVAPGQLIETPLAGSWFGASHRFRIDWNVGSVDYWIDGTQVARHLISFSKSTTLRPAMTDQNLGDGVLKVDWMRLTPYSTSGSYTSPIYDAGMDVAWQTLSYLADLPTGASVTVQVRTGATPDGTNWGPWTTLSSGGSIGTFTRYAQYRVTLSTTATGTTPTVKEVALAFVK
jgi:hypothetical protein